MRRDPKYFVLLMLLILPAVKQAGAQGHSELKLALRDSLLSLPAEKAGLHTDYLAKSKKYRAMKRSGAALSILGSVMSVTGFLSLGPYSNSNAEDDFAMAGLAVVGAGIPLWSVGAYKEKQYMKLTGLPTDYLAESKKCGRMKRTGAALSILGSLMAVGGFLLVGHYHEINNRIYNRQYVSPAKEQAVTVGTLLGVAGVGAGIPLWSAGAYKERQYKNFEYVSIRLNVGPQFCGLGFSYGF